MQLSSLQQADVLARVSVARPPHDSAIRFRGVEDVMDAYQASGSPLDRQIARLIAWAQTQKNSLSQDSDYYLPPLQPAKAPDARRQAENNRTMALFKKRFDTLLWAGIEPGNVMTPQGYRWDMLDVMGLYDDQKLKALVKSLEERNIRVVRMGIPNHRVIRAPKPTGMPTLDRMIRKAAQMALAKGLYPYDWTEFDKIYKALKGAYNGRGIKISLDITHFGLPDIFKNPDDPRQSYFLNPAWPAFLARFTRDVVTRYPDVEAITLVNEVEVTNVFSNVLWNEAWPGRWDHPYFDRALIDRAMLIGKATALARFELEAVTRKQPDPEAFRKVLVNVEATNRQMAETNYNHLNANKFMRFLHSDLILGQDWLYEADLDALETVPLEELQRTVQAKPFEEKGTLDWMIDRYLFVHDPDEPAPTREQLEALRRKLVTGLREIRELHRAFERRYGKTMKSDTVFGVDYYTQSEGNHTVSPAQHIADLRAGKKKGAGNLLLDYWNRHRIPLVLTETSTPFIEEGDRWGRQIALEVANVMTTELDAPPSSHNTKAPLTVPVLGFCWYPFNPTKGWEHALTRPAEESEINNAGLVDEAGRPLNRIPELFQTFEKPGTDRI